MIIVCRDCKKPLEAFNPGKDEMALGCNFCLGQLHALKGAIAKMGELVRLYGDVEVKASAKAIIAEIDDGA